MTVGVIVKIPDTELIKFYALILENGFQIKDFICPTHGVRLNAEIINYVPMIAFKFVKNQNYKFEFSQINSPFTNGKTGISRGVYYRYNPGKNHDTQLNGCPNYDELRNIFTNWLIAIKIHEEARLKRVEMFNSNSDNQIPDQNLLALISKRIIDTIYKPLYKYHSNYDYLKETLLDNSIHLSLPSAFSDKLDCAYKFDSFDEALLFCKNHFSEQADGEIQNYLSQLKSNNNSITEAELQDKLTEFIIVQISGSVCIYCISESKNNIKLWEDYSSKYAGYCIEFDFNSSGPNLTKKLRKVNYVKDVPMRLTGNNLNVEGFYINKSEHFISEHEHRLIVLNEMDREFIKYKINPKSILTITFGKDADERFINEIKHLIKRKPDLSHIKLFKQVFKINRYEYIAISLD